MIRLLVVWLINALAGAEIVWAASAEARWVAGLVAFKGALFSAEALADSAVKAELASDAATLDAAALDAAASKAMASKVVASGAAITRRRQTVAN